VIATCQHVRWPRVFSSLPYNAISSSPSGCPLATASAPSSWRWLQPVGPLPRGTQAQLTRHRLTAPPLLRESQRARALSAKRRAATSGRTDPSNEFLVAERGLLSFPHFSAQPKGSGGWVGMGWDELVVSWWCLKLQHNTAQVELMSGGPVCGPASWCTAASSPTAWQGLTLVQFLSST